MDKRKMLPIGIEDFEEIIRRGFYYADKTQLICDLLNDSAKVTLFTRPRRFGKSLNMSMLRRFFEVGTDPKPFEGLRIAREEKLCGEYQGRYPVISVSLKGVAGANFTDAQLAFAAVIRAEAIRHQYLMDSENLSAFEKNELKSLLEGEMAVGLMGQSLLMLSQMLRKHHGAKVVILIVSTHLCVRKSKQPRISAKFSNKTVQ